MGRRDGVGRDWISPLQASRFLLCAQADRRLKFLGHAQGNDAQRQANAGDQARSVQWLCDQRQFNVEQTNSAAKHSGMLQPIAGAQSIEVLRCFLLWPCIGREPAYGPSALLEERYCGLSVGPGRLYPQPI